MCSTVFLTVDFYHSIVVSIRTLVLTLAESVFYPLSHFSSTSIFFFVVVVGITYLIRVEYWKSPYITELGLIYVCIFNNVCLMKFSASGFGIVCLKL